MQYQQRGDKDEVFVLFDGEDTDSVTQDYAMGLAKRLSETDWKVEFQMAKIHMAIEFQLAKIALENRKDPAQLVKLREPVGKLAAGQKVPRSEIIAERNRIIIELRGNLGPDGKAAAIAKVKTTMEELGVTLDDLK